MQLVRRLLALLTLLALLPAMPAQAQEDQVQGISWEIAWDQPAWPGSDSRQTPSTVSADPALEVYEAVFFRYTWNSSGLTKTVPSEGITANWAAGNSIYAVDTIRYSLAEGQQPFMSSSQVASCSAGPGLSVSRSANGTTMAGVQNLTGRQVNAVLTLDGQSNSFAIDAGDEVVLGSAGKVGSVVVTETDGTACATMSWNWHLLDGDVVTVRALPATWKLGETDEVTLSIEGVMDPIANFQMEISYNADIVSFLNLVNEDTLSEGWEIASATEEGIVRIAAIGGTQITSGGTLLKLQFEGFEAGSSSITFDTNFSSLNGGLVDVEFQPGSVEVTQDLSISGRVTYLTGVPISGYTARLSPGMVDAITDVNGDYQLTAPQAGDYQISFHKDRFADTDDSITAADASRVLRCIVGSENCSALAADADVQNGVNSQDAYLIARAAAGDFTGSAVGVWMCEQPYLPITLQESITDADMRCTVVGDATQNWGAIGIQAASGDLPEVQFGQQEELDDFVKVPLTITYGEGIFGVKFDLDLSEGQVVEVQATGWNVVRYENTFVVFGTLTSGMITFDIKVTAPAGASLMLSDLQVNELPTLSGVVASTLIEGSVAGEGSNLYLPAVSR